VRPGLRLQILLALLLVTLGGSVSVGFISIWRTRQALADERYERAALMAQQAAELSARALESGEPAARLNAAAPGIARAVGASELALFDASGKLVWPVAAPTLETDASGRAAAAAGMPPFARRLPRGRLALYAPVGPHVLRTIFSLDESVDATLARTRNTVVLLGALNGLVLLAAAALILRATVVRPVLELERAAGRVAAGDLTARVPEPARGPGELGRLADAFDRMTASLQEGRESLIRSTQLAGVGRLAAGVAHEVGNPLAAILGYVETLLGDTPERPIDPALRRDMLARVRAETERIHKIIQELLEYSRPPRDELEDIALARVVDAALTLVKVQARFKELSVRVELPADLPEVRASVGRLTQVVLNLLLNAADASEGEGEIRISGYHAGGRVVLAVEDSGPGVPPELRARIFDPFFTTKEVGRGTGLGLSVSQSIVEAFGGKLRLADSARGARFEIELPATSP
jgi:two-component system, NtrC family, sensor kinase